VSPRSPGEVRGARRCGALDASVSPRSKRIGVGSDVQVSHPSEKETTMTATSETGDITGTQDKDYNLIWFTEQCLSNALRLELYIKDAERGGDNELADLFRKAQADSRKGAEQGKTMLKARL
jgi:hypothetical protein